MSRRQKDRVSSLFFLVVAAGISIGSLKFSLGNISEPGPGFFSFLVGLILGFLSFLVFLNSSKGLSGEEKEAFWENPRRAMKVAYITIAVILYTIGMNYLGFSLSTFLFMAYLLSYIEPQRWPVVLAMSTFSPAIAYGVFNYWLDVSLPTGIVGF